MIISDYGVDTIIFPLEDFENPLYAKEYPDIPSDSKFIFIFELDNFVFKYTELVIFNE